MHGVEGMSQTGEHLFPQRYRLVCATREIRRNVKDQTSRNRQTPSRLGLGHEKGLAALAAARGASAAVATAITTAIIDTGTRGDDIVRGNMRLMRVRQRERERERKRERQRDRERHRERQRETQRETERERERKR